MCDYIYIYVPGPCSYVSVCWHIYGPGPFGYLAVEAMDRYDMYACDIKCFLSIIVKELLMEVYVLMCTVWIDACWCLWVMDEQRRESHEHVIDLLDLRWGFKKTCHYKVHLVTGNYKTCHWYKHSAIFGEHISNVCYYNPSLIYYKCDGDSLKPSLLNNMCDVCHYNPSHIRTNSDPFYWSVSLL